MKKSNCKKKFSVCLILCSLIIGIIGCTKVEKAQVSDDYIWNNGYCDYVLVIPEKATSYEISASDEFVELFKEATTYKMSVVKDNELSENQKFISLGNTKQLRETDMEISKSQLGYSGYKIKTVGNNVYISGDVSRNCPGTLYGVYGFMNKCFNFKQYSKDCFKIDKKGKLKLEDLDITDIPDIDMRSVGFLDLNQDAQYANRMRLQQFNGSSTGNEWIMNGHSQLESLLPYAVYGTAHPEWYCDATPGGHTLCYTAEGVVEEMAKRVETELQINTKAEYFMIGQSDCNKSCDCDGCKTLANSYGGSYSAVQMEFINKVARAVREWIDVNQPGRHVEFYIFAYWWSLDPPGIDPQTNQRYVTLDDNVGIMWAPLAMNYKYDIKDAENSRFYSSITAWTECTKNITVYYYPVDFHQYLIPFNDFGSIKPNIEFLKSIGCKYYFTQGNSNDTCGAALQDLKVFVQSQLLWDCSQNVEDLAKEFITNYFGLASKSMQKYYDVLRSWFAINNNNALSDSGLTYGDFLTQDAFPKEFVDELDSIFESAHKEIESLKSTDSELYETLYYRIEKERLTEYFIDLSIYSAEYSSTALFKKVEQFRKIAGYFNITLYCEGGYIDTFLSKFAN